MILRRLYRNILVVRNYCEICWIRGKYQFEAFHKAYVKKYLKLYLIGMLECPIKTSKMDATEDYRKLRKQLWKDTLNVIAVPPKNLIWLSLICSGVFLVVRNSPDKGSILSAFLVGMGVAAFISRCFAQWYYSIGR